MKALARTGWLAPGKPGEGHSSTHADGLGRNAAHVDAQITLLRRALYSLQTMDDAL
jgi:hypothetical protein